jgi:hypothetical protein
MTWLAINLPARANILHQGFKTFNLKADRGATRKNEIDPSGWGILGGEADVQEIEFHLRFLEIKAMEADFADPLEMKAAPKPLTLALARPAPVEAGRDQREFMEFWRVAYFADLDLRILQMSRENR